MGLINDFIGYLIDKKFEKEGISDKPDEGIDKEYFLERNKRQNDSIIKLAEELDKANKRIKQLEGINAGGSWGQSQATVTESLECKIAKQTEAIIRLADELDKANARIKELERRAYIPSNT